MTQQQKQQQQQQHKQEQQQSRDTRGKISAAQNCKDKRKKKVQHTSSGSSGDSRKRSKDTEIFGMKIERQMIVDQFGDGWYKSIVDILVGQLIAALFGDGVT